MFTFEFYDVLLRGAYALRFYVRNLELDNAEHLYEWALLLPSQAPFPIYWQPHYAYAPTSTIEGNYEEVSVGFIENFTLRVRDKFGNEYNTPFYEGEIAIEDLGNADHLAQPVYRITLTGDGIEYPVEMVADVAERGIYVLEFRIIDLHEVVILTV